MLDTDHFQAELFSGNDQAGIQTDVFDLDPQNKDDQPDVGFL